MATGAGRGTRARRSSTRLSSTPRICRSRTRTRRARWGRRRKSPNISIQVNVNARQLSETDYEVDLVLEGSAGEGAETLFKFELNYAGVFRVRNIPAEQVHPVVMIECPRLLFPFARQIVADAVRNGGFPPLYVDPIDFAGLYRQKVESQGAAALRRGAVPIGLTGRSASVRR